MSLIADPAMDTRGHTAVDLAVTLGDGRVFKNALDIALGFPGADLTAAQHRQRFDECMVYAASNSAKLALGSSADSRADSLFETIENIAQCDNIQTLITQFH